MARTIIVGDVHGCLWELGKLLETVGFGGSDRLVFVGDLIARGPDSSGVLRLVRETHARSVIGNHEERMLAARAARERGKHGPRLGPAHYRLLHRLSDVDWQLLESLPPALHYPEHDLAVVHAGVLPDKPLDEQEPWTLTHIRSIAPDGRASAAHDFVPWAAKYQRGPHIAFGHNSRLELQLHQNATGLDTACVYGGRLTALVLEQNEPVPKEVDARRQLLVSIQAREQYYAGIRA